ncbi:hypothetical protein VNO80_08018 [Phaseolus coccineus]|uniref:Uncharacterized protein n=1 Tax=Phaseolus coccineus TaxID=3886 RepID=A0AAN9RJ07_PHACN
MLQGSSSSDPDHNAINILSPFEFIILEYCLKTVSSELDDQVKTFEQETHSVLDQIISKIWIVSNAKTEVINEIKVQLGDLTTCVQKVRDQLEQLNRDDKRKAEMCLTKKFDQQISFANRTVPDFDAGGLSDKDNKPLDVKELETLLNTYLMQNNETLKKLSTLRRYVDKEEWIIWKKAHQIFKLKLGLLGFIGVVGWGWSLFLYWK